GVEAMKFGWQRLNAEYAKQFGIKTPNLPPKAAEVLLVNLIDEVRQRDSLAEIAELVSARIESVLRPTSLYIFYRSREGSEFVSSRSASHSRAPQGQASQDRAPQGLSAEQTLTQVVAGVTAEQRLSEQQMLLGMLEGSKEIRDF